MKKIIILICVVLIMLTFTGCSDAFKEMYLDYVKSSSSDTQNNLKTIGDEEYGYVQIPSDWVKYDEASVQGVTYASVDLSSSVTLARNSSEEKGNDEDAEKIANALLEELEKSNPQYSNVTEVTLSGYNAYRVYYVLDGYATVTWFFYDSNGMGHMIIANTAMSEIDSLMADIEGTYTV